MLFDFEEFVIKLIVTRVLRIRCMCYKVEVIRQYNNLESDRQALTSRLMLRLTTTS